MGCPLSWLPVRASACGRISRTVGAGSHSVGSHRGLRSNDGNRSGIKRAKPEEPIDKHLAEKTHLDISAECVGVMRYEHSD